MEALEKFYNDKQVKEAVEHYIMNYLGLQAVDAVFNGKDTTGIRSAKNILQGAFSSIDNLFNKDSKKPVNHAR